MTDRKCPRNLQKCQFIKHLLCSEDFPRYKQGALCLTSGTVTVSTVGPKGGTLEGHHFIRVGYVCPLGISSLEEDSLDSPVGICTRVWY